jgi:hypothetical protein
MKIRSATMILSALCLSVISCGIIRSTHPEKPSPAKSAPTAASPKLVGRVATVPADKRFVLIQSYGKWEMEAGAILTTRGPEDRAANLRVTGEKLGEFAAADRQSGTLEKGDAVYFQSTAPPITTFPSSELPKNQSEAVDKNVKKND